MARELRLVGSFGFHQSDIVELLDLLDVGRLTIANTVTHRFGLEDYELGLAALRDRSSNPIRVVITSDAESASHLP